MSDLAEKETLRDPDLYAVFRHQQRVIDRLAAENATLKASDEARLEIVVREANTLSAALAILVMRKKGYIKPGDSRDQKITLGLLWEAVTRLVEALSALPGWKLDPNSEQIIRDRLSIRP